MLWYYGKGKPKDVIELKGRLDTNGLSQESDARIDVILRGHGLAIADMASPLTLGENEIVRQLDESILDLFSRFTVGWAVSAVNDRHLTIKALDMALKRRWRLDRRGPYGVDVASASRRRTSLAAHALSVQFGEHDSQRRGRLCD
jgi:hypothetical protein